MPVTRLLAVTFLAIATLAAACRQTTPTDDAGAPSASASGSAAGSAPAVRPTTTASATPAGVPASNGGPELQSACYAYAKARCMRLSKCEPNKLALDLAGSLQDGDFNACIPRSTQMCLYERGPKASATTADAIKKCAKALEAASCADVRADAPADCALPPGKIATGKACAFDVECAAGLCARAAGTKCGTCVDSAKEGADCTERCGGGLVCVDKKCAKRAAAGGACTANAACAAGLTCIKDKCTKALGEGAACDPDRRASRCDEVAGLYCAASSKTCKPLTLAKAGESCAEEGRACRGDATCEDGTCVKTLMPGAACAPTGAMCDPPGECIGGVCTIPDATACDG